MSDATIENPPERVDPASIPMTKKGLDKGFKRNILILGCAVFAAVVVIAVVIFGARSQINGSKSKGPTTSIEGMSGVGGSKPADMTPADENRLNRVQVKQSEDAQAAKETYIPKDLPLKPELSAPAASNNGPGNLGQRGYTDGTQQPQNDPAREANIKRGIEVQLNALLAKFEPPGTGSAGPYSPPGSAANSASASGAVAAGVGSSAAAQASAAAATAPVLMRGLKIASARLVSPLETAKSDFVSAEITSGPLLGAYLIGKGKIVGDENIGVTLNFTRMSFDGEDYVVDVIALDNATSYNSVAADIDTKFLQRSVLPVLFATAQAYFGTVAQPGSTVVSTPGAGTQVVTPVPQTRQAAAAGVAAGLARIGDKYANQKNTAFMPVNTNIGLLFNAPVLTKNTK